MGETTDQAQYPGENIDGHDLDPDADADLVVTASVGFTQAVLIAANSQDDENWSASVRWVDGSGTVYGTESATDIALAAVDNDSARLTRKGPKVEVTFTSDAGAGTQNRLNAYVDAHR